MFGWTGAHIGGYLKMLEPEIEEVVKLRPALVSQRHVKEARAGTTSDKDAARVLEKAVEGELSTRSLWLYQ